MLVLTVSVFGTAATASADSMTTLPSFSDPRGAMPARSGHIIKRARYGPYTVPANGQLYNNISFGAAAPCTNCWITDIVPSLVYESDANNANGTVANLNNNAMMHHFVLINPPPYADVVCPSGIQGGLGQRFFAAGNERSQMHLPSPYGYYNTSSAFRLIYHLVNKAPVAKNLSIEIVYQYRPNTHPVPGEGVTPLWLDIDGCGDSEYPIGAGYTDTAADWTSTVSGRMIAANGHLHDVDITNAAPCVDHCPEKGHGIAVSAELVGGPSGNYFGPSPPNNPPPSGLTGATLCRSEGYYGTSWAVAGGNQWRGHLDTMSNCGVDAVLPGAQSQAFPASGKYSFEGYPINSGQVIRLHSEYQNNTGETLNDVMGIMMAFVVPKEPGYPRPLAATPVQVSLVPAYNQCTSPNRVHGPPDFPGASNPDGSCNPPAQSSGALTVGTSDANGAAPNFVGTARMSVINGNAATAADEADVRYKLSLKDVRCKAGVSTCGAANAASGADYTGQVRMQSVLRIIDRYNGPGEVGVGQDTPFGVTASCSGTASTAAGSNCTLDTTADAVLPGVVKEVRRSVWQSGQVQVFDGGSDGVVSTNPNTLFATQGVFVP